MSSSAKLGWPTRRSITMNSFVVLKVVADIQAKGTVRRRPTRTSYRQTDKQSDRQTVAAGMFESASQVTGTKEAERPRSKWAPLYKLCFAWANWSSLPSQVHVAARGATCIPSQHLFSLRLWVGGREGGRDGVCVGVWVWWWWWWCGQMT